MGQRARRVERARTRSACRSSSVHRPPRAVVGDVEVATGPFPCAVRCPRRPTRSRASARPHRCSREQSRPADRVIRRSGAMSFAGLRPVKNLYMGRRSRPMWPPARASGWDRGRSRPPRSPGRASPPGPDRQRRHAARWRGGRAPVDVHVVRDVGRALGRGAGTRGMSVVPSEWPSRSTWSLPVSLLAARSRRRASATPPHGCHPERRVVLDDRI